MEKLEKRNYLRKWDGSKSCISNIRNGKTWTHLTGHTT